MDASSATVTPRSDGHLVLVVVELDVVEVSSKSGLQPQPALIEPGLQLLTVVDELKHPELSLQLLPPENTAARQDRRQVAKCYVCVSMSMKGQRCSGEDLLLQRDTSDLYCVSRALTLL